MNINDTILDPATNDDIEVFQKTQTIRARREDFPGTIIEITMVDGVPHSIDDKPSYRQFDEKTGREGWLTWHDMGVESRVGEASTLMYFDDGSLCARHWRIDGKAYRADGGPTSEGFEEGTGRPTLLQYQRGSIDFRVDGPAFMQIDPISGITNFECWSTDPTFSGRHREDGAARILRVSDVSACGSK